MSAPLTAEDLLARLPNCDAPLAAGQKRFRVTVLEWLSHVIILDAADANAAEELAGVMWSDLGGDAFRFSDQGLDGFQVEEIEGGAVT
ncbi:MAG: hypothetical protein AB7G40_05520 [Hyphomonadaceae bacterium]